MNDLTPIKMPQQLILTQMQNNSSALSIQRDLYFNKGEDPLSSVNTQKYFYFVISGKIKIYQVDLATAKEQILYILTYGDMFDVVSLLDHQSSEYISEVLEDAHLIQVPLSDVEKMILEDAKFRQYFYAYLAKQLKSMEELAISLSFYDVYQRVIRLFTRFSQTKDGKTSLEVIDNLKHDDIAAMVGTVRKVVNRTLQKLKKDEIIELSRKKIEIKNFQKLLEKLSI